MVKQTPLRLNGARLYRSLLTLHYNNNYKSAFKKNINQCDNNYINSSYVLKLFIKYTYATDHSFLPLCLPHSSLSCPQYIFSHFSWSASLPLYSYIGLTFYFAFLLLFILCKQSHQLRYLLLYTQLLAALPNPFSFSFLSLFLVYYIYFISAVFYVFGSCLL